MVNYAPWWNTYIFQSATDRVRSDHTEKNIREAQRLSCYNKKEVNRRWLRGAQILWLLSWPRTSWWFPPLLRSASVPNSGWRHRHHWGRPEMVAAPKPCPGGEASPAAAWGCRRQRAVLVGCDPTGDNGANAHPLQDVLIDVWVSWLGVKFIFQ